MQAEYRPSCHRHRPQPRCGPPRLRGRPSAAPPVQLKPWMQSPLAPVRRAPDGQLDDPEVARPRAGEECPSNFLAAAVRTTDHAEDAIAKVTSSCCRSFPPFSSPPLCSRSVARSMRPERTADMVTEGVGALLTNIFPRARCVDVAPRAHTPVAWRSALRTFGLLLSVPRPSGFNSHPGALECSATPERPKRPPA